MKISYLREIRILNKNIDFNASNYGRTAFTGASISGHTDIVKLLLDHSDIKNIDLNAGNKSGWTGFMLACTSGHKDVVQLLLDHSDIKNIDLNIKTNNGWTPFTSACFHGHIDVV